jgi:hypothetical protein
MAVPGKLLRVVQRLRHASGAFLKESALASKFPRISVAVAAVLEAIDDAVAEEALEKDFTTGRREKLWTPKERKNVLRRLSRTHQRLREEKKRRQAEWAPRLHNRLAHAWCLRVGLGPPDLPLRTLSNFCRDLGTEAQFEPVFSHTTVVRVRDAFAEAVKGLNREELAERGREQRTMLLCHVHDEASMRIRSYVEHADEGLILPVAHRRIARSRSTKIQNSAMWACFGATRMEVFLELQPLGKKDAATLTHALVQAVGYAADAAVSRRTEEAAPLRVVHLLTGDGIPTNMAAARRVFHHFRQREAMCYRLLVWSCASHQANLVVQIAVCGSLTREPIQADSICATCSRLFKHLGPLYAEELCAQEA